LTYTRHAYAILVGLKSLVLNARIPPPGRGHPTFNTLRF